VGSNKGAIIGL
nr:Chain A, Amyloid beta A4 protein [Homo sapiens]